jgi:hypothetical protein
VTNARNRGQTSIVNVKDHKDEAARPELLLFLEVNEYCC